MNLRLTVRDASGTAVQDFEVVAEPETPLSSVLGALPQRTRDQPCYLGYRRLDPDATVAGSGLLHGSVLSVGGPGPRATNRPARAAGALRVLGGPDAGLTVWLTPGSHTMGRQPGVAVSLGDPSVRPEHALIEVGWTAEATVTDLAPPSPKPTRRWRWRLRPRRRKEQAPPPPPGTLIDRVPVTEPTALGPQAVLRVGDDRLRWVPLPDQRLKTTRSRDGRLEFDRAFAPAPAAPAARVRLPQAPRQPDGAGTRLASLTSALAPLGMSVAFAASMRQPLFMLFALLAPVGYLVPLAFERRQRTAREREFAKEKAGAEEKIRDHLNAEERQRRALAPDELDLLLAAGGDTRGLWPRNAASPDGLVLRVGTADQPATVDLDGDPWDGFESPLLHDAPVTVDLRDIGVLGVAGPPRPVNDLVRWLVAQLATLRDPDELRLMVIASGDGEALAWTRWLPHLGAGEDVPCWVGNTVQTRAARIEELRDLVAGRLAERAEARGGGWTDTEVVVVLDGALALRQVPGMKEILRDGPGVGVYLICADRRNMGEASGVCELDGGTLRLTRSRSDHPTLARPEGLGRAAAERLGRDLAPMRDRLTLARSEQAIPPKTRFLDLLDVQAPAAEDVRRLWAADPEPTTAVPLGADADGVVTIDLHEQGPHTMLAGATGAGKSVLLQTLVTSLLLHNRPDQLNLVLVDFKGGGAFLPFQDCPHVVALIRSTGDTAADVFDEAQAERVLASVRAEVNRRESVLAPFGGEIRDYWKAGRRMPRLVMIFDEFARVLEVSPDFLKELVNVSAKGRSLGMHLILSTQSLQGKLSAELKNNISLRVSLRQNEPAESTEVLEVPDAAGIPGRLRGRGMVLCTKDDRPAPRPFQSGYLGDPPPTGEVAPATVRMAPWATLGLPRPEPEARAGGADTDQDLAIRAVLDAARDLELPAPFRPVLPPLPAEVTLADLERRATRPVGASEIPYGLADDPAGQAQPPAVLDLAGTDRLLCAGGPQSGRTTFARTLVAGVAERFSPDRVHLYVIENQPAGLAGYERLPHCGGVFSPAEPDRVRRFVTWLDGEVQRRKGARFTRPGEPDPWIVVVIDGWEYFDDRDDPMWDETDLLPAMRGIIAAGSPVGVHVVATGGQSMLSGRLADLYTHRLLLPFPQEDTRRGHLQAGVVPPPFLPGRAIEAASGHHVHVCTPGAPGTPGRPATPGPWRAGRAAARPPRVFPPLPVRVSLGDLELPDPPPAPTWVPIGVGGPDVATAGVDLFGGGAQTLLVSGPPGSGRSTTAATLAHGLRRVGVGVLAVAPPRSPLPGLLPDDEGVRVVTGLTVKDAQLREAAEAFGDGPYAVVVDDLEQLGVTTEGDDWDDEPNLLEEIAAPDALGRRALVLCGDALPVVNGQRPAFRRLADDVLTTGIRVLLSPAGSATARDHGFTLEPDQYFTGPPGRGYLSAGRTVALVHIAVR